MGAKKSMGGKKSMNDKGGASRKSKNVMEEVKSAKKSMTKSG